MVGILLTGVIVLKPKEKAQLDNVILKQEVNNKTFAMYKEEGNEYVPVTENKFPDMYVLNLAKSKCIDNNGNEINGVLSYENDKVIITSGNTIYCYLYFDKSLGLEIKEKEPNKLSAEIKGAMYRFQGQQNENVNNYICFGTSDKEECTANEDKHMYRIIGIEAETGRVKVIKMKALKDTYQWWDDSDTDIEFPESKIYEAIKETDFLKNTNCIPQGWEEKISDNTWMYGDMISNDSLGARQTGEGLYLAETGQKGTNWSEKTNQENIHSQSAVVDNPDSPLHGQPVYYIPHNDEKWTKTFESKVSLMYLHDYYYSVSDEAICHSYDSNYDVCRTGWMHLSQNDEKALNVHEWTMSRFGWKPSDGWFNGRGVDTAGYSGASVFTGSLYVRPVFYINASQTLASGSGTLENPFVIK